MEGRDSKRRRYGAIGDFGRCGCRQHLDGRPEEVCGLFRQLIETKGIVTTPAAFEAVECPSSQ